MDPELPKLPAVGEVVGGKYRVERVIGRGGMGTVLAVRHLGLDEPRALKLMLPRGLELPQARERFFREARAAAKLRSEHAVAVHDVGVFPDGFPYIEMELLEGTDLGALLKRVHGVPVANAVEWIAQACEPVGEAHALGIVHRDIKPGNLFLARTQAGREIIKVLDFGIAKTASADTDPSLTGTNASFGSPMYMSPEQMRGARFADPRSDLWALGVVLFELMTGKRPFVSESVTALALIVTQEPAPHPRSIRADVPPAIDAIVMRCLEKAPERRFASAAELAAALRSALGEPASPRASLPSLSHAAPGPAPSLGHAAALAPGAIAGAGRAPSLPGVAGSFGPSFAHAPHQGGGDQGGGALVPPPAPSWPTGPGAGAGGVASVEMASGPTGPTAPARAADGGGSISTSPSHPSVGTLSTTIGGSRGPRPALLVGGAVVAAAMGVGMALLAWHTVGGEDPAPAASGTGAATADVSPPTSASGPASTPSDPTGAEPTPPPVEPAPAAAGSGPSPMATAAPSSPSASASAGTSASPAPGAAGPPRATSRPDGGARPPRPKTGFGGID